MIKTPKKIMSKLYYSSIKLEHILDSGSFPSFIQPESWMIQDAAIRRLLAVSYISELLIEKHNSFCSCHPEIPFTELSGMKKYLTKVQDGTIDLFLIWNTIEKIIPDLIDKIEAIFRGK